MTTYSESAEGVIISKARALQELVKHGVGDEENQKDFFTDCGEKEEYDAGDVLRWLGY